MPRPVGWPCTYQDAGQLHHEQHEPRTLTQFWRGIRETRKHDPLWRCDLFRSILTRRRTGEYLWKQVPRQTPAHGECSGLATVSLMCVVQTWRKGQIKFPFQNYFPDIFLVEISLQSKLSNLFELNISKSWGNWNFSSPFSFFQNEQWPITLFNATIWNNHSNK